MHGVRGNGMDKCDAAVMPQRAGGTRALRIASASGTRMTAAPRG
jgi:hypothetical protein